MKFNKFVSGVEKKTPTEMTRDSRVIIDCSRDDVEALEDDNSLKEETEEQERDNKESTVTEERTEPTVRRSNRERSGPDYYGIWVNSVNTITEPLTVKEALSSSEKENWKRAMQAEFESLHLNQVWDLVPPLKDRKVINSKWVFKCKLGENGLVERYKARLVAQGYSQRPGLDYEETFSPVVRFESVHSVIALAVHGKMKLHQMDVKTAFLNGELTKEVFMKQPEHFVEEENLVCRMKQNIYGLKQSPRCWNIPLDDHLRKVIHVYMCLLMENLSLLQFT